MSFSDFTTDDELLAKRLKEVAESVKNKPNEMDAKLEGRYISCSGEEKSMTMEFPESCTAASSARCLITRQA